MKKILYCLMFLYAASNVSATVATKDEASSSVTPIENYWSVSTGYLWVHTPNPFTFWTKSYKKNPLPYEFITTTLTYHRSLGEYPGNWELLGSLVYTNIIKGPEHRWIGGAVGLRYNFMPRAKVLPFADVRFGVGGIDASGVKHGQEKDLSFTYLIGLGVRIRTSEHSVLTLQTLTQHISNGWQTNPSEGIDVTGLAVSYGWRY